MTEDDTWTSCWRRIVGLVFVSLSVCATASANDDALFESKVRPLLAGNCFRCHGDQKVAGQLRVDSRESLLTGGDSGPAIVPGRPDESLLIQAIRRSADVAAMPPDTPLPRHQVEALEQWIRQGAVWPAKTPRFASHKHWAFEQPQRVEPPVVRNSSWLRGRIDAFVLARLEASGLQPAEAADRRTLIRRATYDLVGLPPTPQEVEAFLQDPRPDTQAFSQVVDRLLMSPHYGEHWGRHWLDVVRYADTAGENSDHPLPHAWKYRNWVIQSLNDDKPYDQFVREQLSGDLLATEGPGPVDEYADRVVATGYLAIARRFGHDIDKDIHLTHEDAIDNLGKTFLGLTIGCCRCHDHKYDPLTMRDYYGLYGVLQSTRLSFPGCEPQQQPRDLVPLVPPAEAEAIQSRWNEHVAGFEAVLQELTKLEAAARDSIKGWIADSSRLLASGDVADGQAGTLAGQPLETVVRTGEALLLTVLPQTNHGADTTLVEFEIAELGGRSRRWSVADLVPDLLQGNPHPGPDAASPVWCFLDAQDGLRLLPERLESVAGRPELRAWRNGETPSVLVNTSSESVTVWTSLPPRSFFVHPGPAGPVAVAWLSPMDGKVRISGRIADAHPCGGCDGVAWRLEHIARPELPATLQVLADTAAKRNELQLQRDREVGPKPAIPVAYAAVDAAPVNARIHLRGNPEQLGEEVPRKCLDILGGDSLDRESSSGRLELARWITDAKNPLTARVMVNRIWQWHFGQGLVTTPNDFGSRGHAPLNQALLDDLAIEFVQRGWSIKEMHRQIMLSSAYRVGGQAGQNTWTFAARRLTAEELRDTLLAVSGQLDRGPGQAHPFPPENTWSFTQHGPFASEYDTPRRSVYLMQKRNRRSPFFALFDGADPNASTPVRDVTTVPTQALFFMNDPFVHEQARQFAARLVASAADNRQRLDLACRLLFGRNASSWEHDEFRAFAGSYVDLLKDVEPADRDGFVWQAYARVLFGSNELLWID